MQAVINVVIPVFAIVLTGYLAGVFKILGEEASQALSRFVFYIALPVLLFASMARVEPDEIFNWSFIAAYTLSLLITLVLSIVLVRRLFPRRRLAEASLNGMGAIYGNTGYMGIPLLTIAFGPDGLVPAVVTTVINGALVFGLVGAIVEADMSPAEGPAGIARDIFWGLVKNPLFIAPILGVAASVLRFPAIGPFDAFYDILGAAAGPCALFSLGLFLVGKSLRKDVGEVSVTLVLKLLVQPLIAWVLVVYVFELSPLWGASAVLMAALPTGTGTFVVAQRYRIYQEQTSAASLVSTVLSVVTLSVLFSYYGDLAL